MPLPLAFVGGTFAVPWCSALSFFFQKQKCRDWLPPAGWGDSSSRSNGSVKTHRGGGKKSPWRAPRDPHPPVVPGRPGYWGSATAAKAITSPFSRTSQKPDPRLLSDAATGDPTSYAYVAGPEEGNGRAARKGGGGSATSTGRRHPRTRSLLLRAEGAHSRISLPFGGCGDRSLDRRSCRGCDGCPSPRIGYSRVALPSLFALPHHRSPSPSSPLPSLSPHPPPPSSI